MSDLFFFSFPSLNLCVCVRSVRVLACMCVCSDMHVEIKLKQIWTSQTSWRHKVIMNWRHLPLLFLFPWRRPSSGWNIGSKVVILVASFFPFVLCKSIYVWELIGAFLPLQKRQCWCFSDADYVRSLKLYGDNLRQALCVHTDFSDHDPCLRSRESLKPDESWCIFFDLNGKSNEHLLCFFGFCSAHRRSLWW